MGAISRSVDGTAIAFMLCMFAATAHAEGYIPYDLIGGYGGERHRVECPAGMILVGVSGRRGNWIDGIAPICAQLIANPEKKTTWDPDIVYGPRVVGEYFGGEGGEPYQNECKEGAPVTAMRVRPTWEHDQNFVQGIILNCTRAGDWWFSGDEPNVSEVYMGKPGFGLKMVHETTTTKVGSQRCKGDDVAIGFEHRTGDYLDAISIVCGAPRDPATASQSPDITSVGGASPTRQAPSAPDITGVGGASPMRRTPAPVVVNRPADPAPPVENPPLAPVRYDAPTIMSDAGAPERLDFCLNFGADCGDAAASAFCASKDPQRPHATQAPLEFGIGRSFTIGDRQLCEQENCSSFTHIICSAQ